MILLLLKYRVLGVLEYNIKKRIQFINILTIIYISIGSNSNIKNKDSKVSINIKVEIKREDYFYIFNILSSI